MLIRPERTRRVELQKMLGSLKKNDRVVTIGGIYGTVVNVQKGSEDITIKADENTNTKLRVLRSSVSRVLASDSQAEEKKESL
jgi:preprotein translocase subunit YajC